MRDPTGPTFEITLKLNHTDEQRTTNVRYNEIFSEYMAPGVGDQVGQIFAQALMHLFPVPCAYDVKNIRACIDTMSSSIYETYADAFKQWPEDE